MTLFRRVSRRWAFWFVVAVLGCLTFLGGRWYFRHRQVAAGLQSSLEALDRDEPGWRLQDLEAARATVADDENSALRVRQAQDLVVPNKVDLYLYNRLRLVPPNERLGPVDLDTLRRHLAPQQAAVDKARTLAELPNGRFAVQYQRNVFAVFLPHCQQAREVTSWLFFDAYLRADDGDVKGALQSCRAALNAGRSLGDEPFEISQLFRMACVLEVLTATERVLAQGEAEADDLRYLQQVLEEEERYPRLLVMLRGQRALVNELLDAVEAGDLSLEELGRLTERATGSPADQPGSVDEVRADHPKLVAALTQTVQIARLPPHQRHEPIRALEATLLNGPEPGPIFRLMPSVRRLDFSTRRTEARLRCLIAALAVERYRLLNHKWPERLEDLVPDLLAAVPLDPLDGQPLEFRAYPTCVVVFSRMAAPGWLFASASPARAFDPNEPSPPGVGVSSHVFDPAHRRLPAQPREVKPMVEGPVP